MQKPTIQSLISKGYILVAPGKSKGARAGNPDGYGAVKVKTVVVPGLRDGLHGQILMVAKTMNQELKATRKVDFSGELRLPAHELKRAIAWVGKGRSNMMLHQEVGDVVRPGDQLFAVGPRTRSWSKSDHATYGKVVEAEIGEVEFLVEGEVVGKAKAAMASEIVIKVRFVIEAYDVGDAKLRKAVKAMVQSAEAAGTRAMVKGAKWTGAIAGAEGLVKLEDKARSGMVLLEDNVEAEVEQDLDPSVAQLFKEIYKDDPTATVTDDMLVIKTNKAMIVELDAIIEAASVAESVGRATFGLPQLLFLSAFKAGNKIVRRWIDKELDQRCKQLYYTMVASSPLNGGVDKPVPKFVIGTDKLDVSFREDATDEQILDAVGAAFPTGLMLVFGEERFYLRVDYVKSTLASDDFGLTYIDTGSVVMNLLRGAMDPEMATATGQNWENMIRKVRGDIGGRLTSQNGKVAVARVYGERIATICKVVFSNAVGMDEAHLSPFGGVAQEYAELFGCDVSDLDGQYVYGLRDPGVIGGVYQLVLNPFCTPNTITVNAARMRPENGGDADGDLWKGADLTEEEALELKAELDALIPGGDSVKRALGVSGHHPAFKLFGEKLKGVDNYGAMVAKTQRMPIGDWLKANAQVAKSAKELMTVAYDIMESMTIMFSLGKAGLHSVLLGWFLYEHRGLSGDDLFSMDHAMVYNLLDLFRTGGWHDGWEKPMEDSVAATLVELIKETGVDIPATIAAIPGVKQTKRDLVHGAELSKLKNSKVYESYDYVPWAKDFAYTEILPIYHMLWCLDRRRFGSAGKAALALTKPTEDGTMFIDVVGAKHGLTETFAFHIARTTAMWVAKAIVDGGGNPLVDGWYAVEQEA